MMRLADSATASMCEYCGSVAERGVVGFKRVGIFFAWSVCFAMEEPECTIFDKC
jgi:hypothetical protein